jgi:AcrR family transcriptional regulator
MLPVPKKPSHKPPQQARSRESLRRMLDATENVLEKYGAEGLTLARVAKEAKLSAANVYRRFRDKDALIAAVFNRFGDMNAAELEQLETQVDPETIRKIGIRQFTRNWVAGMIQGFRYRTGLVRAAVLYSQSHPNALHVKRKSEIETMLFRRHVQNYMLWRDEIRHPDPEYAVSYAIISVALTLRELIIFDNAAMFSKLVPMDDDHLREELPRAFLRYLGVEP